MKHANPCGIAVGGDVAEAHRKANACDPVSAFGGVIAANRRVTAEMADQVADIFTEVIVAPGYEPAALGILMKKKNQRLLRSEPPRAGADGAGAPDSGGAGPAGGAALERRQIRGGLLIQETHAGAERGGRPSR